MPLPGFRTYEFSDFNKVEEHPSGSGKGKWVYHQGFKKGTGEADDGTILNCFALPLSYKPDMCDLCGDEQVHYCSNEMSRYECVRCTCSDIRQGRLFVDDRA